MPESFFCTRKKTQKIEMDETSGRPATKKRRYLNWMREFSKWLLIIPTNPTNSNMLDVLPFCRVKIDEIKVRKKSWFVPGWFVLGWFVLGWFVKKLVCPRLACQKLVCPKSWFVPGWFVLGWFVKSWFVKKLVCLRLVCLRLICQKLVCQKVGLS